MYTILLKKHAKKFIDALSKNEKQRIVSAIEQLPYGDDIKILKGYEKEKLFRLRVGKYRIIYTVNHGALVVYVIDADSRGQIYKRY